MEDSPLQVKGLQTGGVDIGVWDVVVHLIA